MANIELTRLEQDIAVIEQTLNALMEPGLAVAHIDDSAFESIIEFDKITQ